MVTPVHPHVTCAACVTILLWAQTSRFTWLHNTGKGATRYYLYLMHTLVLTNLIVVNFYHTNLGLTIRKKFDILPYDAQ